MIVGLNIEAIDAEKGAGAGNNIQVNYEPKIKEVSEASVDAIDDKVARIDFSFAVNYMAGGEKAAHITMDGHVLWRGNVDQIIESWEENGQIPEEVNIPLMNEMYRKLLSEAVGVANTLNLLPPIPTPKVQKE
ncbi:MAG: hypothetical protein ABEK16_05195 [Candidatus Nanohalobium sp.]